MRVKNLQAIIIDKKDNVATALRLIEKGEVARVEIDNLRYTITLSASIPAGHKFALKNILKKEPIIKYGEIIGLATQKIAVGQHVHIQNVEGLKGRGDKR